MIVRHTVVAHWVWFEVCNKGNMTLATLYQQFEDQANATPSKVAIWSHGRQYSYQDLQGQVNRLAARLLERWLKRHNSLPAPDTPIALYIERHPDAIVAILAALKAGFAYVPIATMEPRVRVAFLLNDCGATMVMCQSHLLDDLAGFDQDKVSVDAASTEFDTSALVCEPPSWPSRSERDLAYIIYTSGTSGKPKGVMIEQRSVSELIASQTQIFDFSGDEVVLWLASYSFDASVEQLFLPLLNGATICVIDDEKLKSADEIKRLIAEQGVTHLHATPTLLVALGEFDFPHRLKRVISGGDTLAVALKARFGPLLINEYGPTETCVTSLECLTVADNAHNNCIGLPVGNTVAYVLDESLLPVEPGVAGELFIGGLGVARGYLNRPELSAKHFVKDPFSLGGRLYKTGDKVVKRSDGQFYFLGRLDGQVKIRGYRIEPAEVQHCLSELAGVAQSVVIDFEQGDSRYLAAYYVASGEPLDADALKHQLSETLPDYMVPSCFIALKCIPLTINGKLALDKLPKPVIASQTAYVAPKQRLEQQLCGIWQQVLGVDKVGIDDNFFAIGGHSINAIVLVGLMTEQLKRAVSLEVLLTHPTIADLSGYLEQQAQDSAQSAIKAAGLSEYPLSFAQQRLMFVETMAQSHGSYHIPFVFSYGRSDIGRVHRAIESVVAQHWALCARYRQHPSGEYFAAIYRSAESQGAKVQTEVLQPQQSLVERLCALSEAPFDLAEQGPVKLYHIVGDDTPVLLCVFHHIAFDLWSSTLFFSQVSEAYDACGEGAADVDVSVLGHAHYGDYVLWQKARLSGAHLDKLLSYWSAHLNGFEQLELAPGNPPVDAPPFAGQNLPFVLDDYLSTRLDRLARTEQTSLNNLLLSGFYLSLWYISGQSDLVVGMPADNRQHPDSHGIVGLFVNTLALRAKIDGEISLSEFIHQVHEVVIGALVHQELPFDKLVDALDIERVAGRHPLFQVMFVFSKALDERAEPVVLSAVDSGLSEGLYHKAKFDLTLFVEQAQQQIKGYLNFACGVFEPAQALRIVDTFVQVLEAMAVSSAAQLPLSQLFLNTEKPRQQGPDWNANDETISLCCIHRMFEQIAKSQPQHIALQFGAQQLSYAELNQKANQLARQIRHSYRSSVGDEMPPDTLIALYFDRSSALIIAMLATLKAGGAYVPISPSYPASRVSYLLSDTQAPLVLSQSRLVESLAPYDIITIAVDDQSVWQHHCDDNLTDIAGVNDLAYIIYTSGTTGRPKGVMIEHQSVMNYLHGVRPYFNPQCQHIDFSTNYCFDLTVTTTLCPLLLGRTVCIYEGELTDAQSYQQHLSRHDIDFIKTTPTLAEALLGDSHVAVNTLFLGGEALSEHVVNRLSAKVAHIFDEYGPTEATVGTTIVQVHPQNSGHGFKVYPNYKLYVLSAQRQCVPVGAVGELYIGGAGLARGYFNQPQLSAERFVADPFITESSLYGRGLMYQTGDLVRVHGDGQMSYLGRSDAQVKIRGYRIELGEIQGVIGAQASVKQAAVIDVRQAGKTQIAAYVVFEANVADNEDGDLIAALKSQLIAELPDYMMPDHFIAIDSIPTTVNGKLDRGALPSVALAQKRQYVAPTTELQRQLCQCWQGVLNIEKVGIEDNFFRIGGDSIVSIKLVSMLRTQGFVLQVKDIFAAPTIERLAAFLSSGKAKLKRLNAEGGALCGRFDLLPVQKWFFGEKLRTAAHYNQAFRLTLPKDISHQEIVQALEALAIRHDMLRCVFGEEGGSYYQQYQSSCTGHWLDVINTDNLTVDDLMARLTQAQSDFDITQGPLWRVVLLKGALQQSLFFAFHHLIIDAVSWRIIAQDMQALLCGQNISDKTSSYRQWVDTVARYAHQHSDEVEYWQEITKDMTDIECNDADRFTQLTLNETLTAGLLRYANQGYNTEINDLLLAALAIALTQTFARKRHWITLEGHGREALDVGERDDSYIDISHTLGWFTTMFPVRLESFAGASGIEQTIISCKERRKAVPVKGLGFGALAINGRLDGRLPNICFNYLGQLDNHQDHEAKAWQLQTDDCGIQVAEDNDHGYALNIIGAVIDGRLRFNVASAVSQSDVFVVAFEQALSKVIEQAKQKALLGGVKTPADYVVDVDMATLARLKKTLPKGADIAALYPASSLQQGFIYHYLSHPNDDAYRVQVLWDYHLALDFDAYYQAWQLASKRFAALRMGFDWQGQLLQVISDVCCISAANFSQMDISHLPPIEHEKAITGITRSMRDKPFDLTKPGLLRFCIVKLADDRYTVIRTEHHAISDGWSSSVLMHWVHHYYDLCVNNQVPEVSEDEAYHLAQQYNIKHQGACERFWQGQIARFVDANDINLMLDKPLDLEQSMQVLQPDGALALIQGQSYRQLKHMCSEHGLTLNAVLQFAWHKLLSVYSGDEQTIVGTVVSGRDIAVESIDQSVGLYINTLPLQVDWSAHHDSLSIMLALQQDIAELNSHSNISLAQLQQGRGKLFHTLLVFENYPKADGTNQPGSISEKARFRQAVEKVDYPLCLSAHERDDTLEIQLAFCLRLLSKTKAKRLLSQLKKLIDTLAQSPKQAHQRLSLLGSGERQLLLNDFNAHRSVYPKGTLHQLFAEQASRQPHHKALIAADRALSYRELDQQSNRLARYIRGCYRDYVGTPLVADQIIGLCFERNSDMVVAILAVLKAGGAYLPLLPQTPTKRLSYMLSDAKCALVLCDDAYVGQLHEAIAEHDDKPVISTICPQQSLSGYAKGALEVVATADDLAYLIYTSGTTGEPKGVMVEHQAAVSFCCNNRYVQTEQVERVASLSSYGFDGFVFDLFYTLLNGKTLYLYQNALIHDPSRLCGRFKQDSIDTFFITTALFNQLIVSELLEGTEVKNVLFGGEAADTHLLAQVQQQLPKLNLIHCYGPTETVVYASAYFFDKNHFNSADALAPIGSALNNKTLLVLNDALELVPVGVPGELYIAGEGLARGYLGADELTKSRFIVNPYATEAAHQKEQKLMYKTGDIVRWLPDGNLLYMSRVDSLVKVRGFRVELEEVQGALTQLAQIKQAIVLSRKKAGIGYLQAYVVPSETDVDVAEVKTQLAKTLPDYMVPGHIMVLDALPLNSNGKVEQRLLPQWQADYESFAAPRNELESQLCDMWQQVLAVPRVGIDQGFFHIGGNSLAAIRLVALVREQLDVDLPLAMLFEHQTIARLAANMSGLDKRAIEHQPSEYYPLSFAQKRLLFIDALEQGSAAYHVPYLFEFTEPANIELLERAFAALLKRHRVLGALYREDIAPEVCQVFDKVKLTIDTIVLEQNAVVAKAMALIARPFDLAVDGAIRVQRLRAPEREYLLVEFHHIAFDGWSWPLFVRDFSAIYQALVEGNEKPLMSLPTLDIDYGDFARWQATLLQDERLAQLLEYWQTQLAGAETLAMPLDHTRPQVSDYRGSGVDFSFPAALSGQLRALAKTQQTTLYTVMLSGFYLCLSSFSGQSDIVVGTPSDNRHHPQVQNLIGFFVNSLALRVKLDPSQSVSALIDEVHRVVSGAKVHQELPFEMLVEALNVPRDIARHPIYQVMFSLNDNANRLDDASPLPFKLADIATQQDDWYQPAKFDLTLFIDDDGEQLSGCVNYATALFTPSTMSRFAECFIQTLKQMVAHNQSALSQLTLLPPTMVRQLLEEVNDNHCQFDIDTLHGLFEAQVAKSPNERALIFDGQAISYQALNQRANRLARSIRQRYLQCNGEQMPPETLIALYLERNIDMVVAILAVLKAGAAYVPISLDFPAARARFILADTQAPVVLCSRKNRAYVEGLCEQGSATLVLIDDNSTINAQNSENLTPLATANDLAYVLYTSGTTGQPKGVMLPHKSALNTIFAMAQIYDIGTGHRHCSWFCDYVFDISVSELFNTIGFGGVLHILADEVRKDPERLAQYIASNALELVFLPPAVLAELPQRQYPRLKTLIFCGERCCPNRCQYWADHYRLYNFYGPTEAAIYASGKQVGAQGINEIGKAIANVQLYVLNGQKQLAPFGAIGELYIGGAGLARGYLNRPELTAEVFAQSQFKINGEYVRLYKTGDLVRWRNPDTLEYIGRNDHQIKLRGYRVELNEIEQRLSEHPSVNTALVVVDDSRQDKRLIGYLTAKVPVEVVTIRRYLQQYLPDHMVPSELVVLDSFVLNVNGKIDRKALPLPNDGKPKPEVTAATPLEMKLLAQWQQVLGRSDIALDQTFFDLGGHSMLLLRLKAKLDEWLERPVSLVELFQYPTIKALGAYLQAEQDERLSVSCPQPRIGNRDIAVIGMAGRFPGAENIETFWRNLTDGHCAVRALTEAEQIIAGVDKTMAAQANYVNACGWLDGADTFDAEFFACSPNEAKLLDPQQRLLLSLCWQGLEHAALAGECDTRTIGVYAGVGNNDYLHKHLLNNSEVEQMQGGYQLLISNDKDFAATRVAYKLGLKGPAVNVQSACSTSLVAVHMACQSIHNGECEMAIAGGARIGLPQAGYLYEPGMIGSPDGLCRTFDDGAQGVVGGSGGAVVVLAPLALAQAQGFSVYALIKGSAINNDGTDKVGYTAPSVNGQSAVIAKALSNAQISADDIDFVEAHGTATPMGDPVEIAALTQAYRQHTSRSGYCAIGSVKTNIGHLDAAAGIAGLIKAVLSLYHRTLPPSLHFVKANTAIDFASTPFVVNAEAKTLAHDKVLRAGVSAFGIGGTNAHVVLEQPPLIQSISRQTEHHQTQLLCLSAKSDNALQSAWQQLNAFIGAHPHISAVDIAYTLQLGRKAFEHRQFGLYRQGASGEVNAIARNCVSNHQATAALVWMFAGQGAQLAGMGRELYHANSDFKAIVDNCAGILEPELNCDIRELMFVRSEQADARIKQTQYAQCALFVFEYALAKVLLDLGVKPKALIGHSIGEYVGACLAGVFSLVDGLKVVAARGRLMQAMPQGSMVAVALSEAQLQPLLGNKLAIAAINAPQQCVVSGENRAIDAFIAQLYAMDEVAYKRLDTSHAYHSPMMAEAAAAFVGVLSQVRLNAPSLPLLSNVTGQLMTAHEATSVHYWQRQMLACVRFDDNINAVRAQYGRVLLLEVSPVSVLCGAVKPSAELSRFCCCGKKDNGVEDKAPLLALLGRLWLNGVEVDWQKFYRGSGAKRIALPGHPLHPSRYWIAPEPRLGALERQISEVVKVNLQTLRGSGLGAEDIGNALEASCFATVGEMALQAMRRAIKTLNSNDNEQHHNERQAPSLSHKQQQFGHSNERQVAELFKAILGVEQVDANDSFLSLGGSSLLALKLVAGLKKLGLELDLSRAASLPMATLAAGVDGGSQEQMIVPLKIDSGNRDNVFFIHPVGGSVLLYAPLTQRLDDGFNYYGIQNINIYHKQLVMADSLEGLAGAYVEALLRIQDDGEFHLAGSSMGGAIAYEMAYQLTKRGKTVASLSMFDSWATYSAAFRDKATFKQQIWHAHQDYQDSLSVLEQPLRAPLIEASWALMCLLTDYVPRQSDLVIDLYKAKALDTLHASNDSLADNGWQQYTSEPVKVYAIDGDHATMHEGAGLEQIVKQLNYRLISIKKQGNSSDTIN